MRLFFLLAGVGCLFGSLQAQYTFSSLYQESNDSTVILYERQWRALNADLDVLRKDSFVVQDIDLLMDGFKLRYWAVCRRGLPMGDTLQDIPRWDSLIFQKRAMASQGYTLQDIEHYVDKKQTDHFVGLWHPGETTHKVWKFDSWRGLEKKVANHEEENLYMVDLEATHLEDGTFVFLCIFHKGGIGGKTYINRTTDFTEFNLDRLRRRKSGYRMIDFEQYDDNGQTWYTAIYRKGEGRESLRTKLDQELLESTTKELHTVEGLQLIDLEVLPEKASLQIPEKEK